MKMREVSARRSLASALRWRGGCRAAPGSTRATPGRLPSRHGPLLGLGLSSLFWTVTASCILYFNTARPEPVHCTFQDAVGARAA